jgi:hypothetical protein
MLSSRFNKLVTRIPNVLKRRAHDDGWLVKNKSIEQHGGLRESTYRHYKLNAEELVWHSVFFFIPAYVLYQCFISDLMERDAIIGTDRKYGLLPVTSFKKSE